MPYREGNEKQPEDFFEPVMGNDAHTGWQAVQSLRLQQLGGDVREIKSALRDLTSAINRLALIEERQVRANEALSRLEIRVESLEIAAPASSAAAKWVERAIVALIGALFAILAKHFGNGGVQ